MQQDRERLMKRRAEMIGRGDWRDETLLDHLARAVATDPDKTALVAIRSDGAEGRPGQEGHDRRRNSSHAQRNAQIGNGRRLHIAAIDGARTGFAGGGGPGTIG